MKYTAVFARRDASTARSKSSDWFGSLGKPSEKMTIDLRPRAPARPRDNRSVAPKSATVLQAMP
jgi:hypothetical protein